MRVFVSTLAACLLPLGAEGSADGYSLRVASDGKGNGSLDLDFSTLIDLSAKLIGRAPAFIDEMGEDDQGALLQEARDFLLQHLGAGSQA